MSKHTTAASRLGTITTVTFIAGLLTVTVAYMSATFARGGGAVTDSKFLQVSSVIGTSVMYAALLAMPAIPLLHHHERKDLNSYDYATAGALWTGYLLLPVALSLWDQPRRAKTGAVIMGVSVLSVLSSAFLAEQARKKRRSPSAATY